jgi:hypothetical protein
VVRIYRTTKKRAQTKDAGCKGFGIDKYFGTITCRLAERLRSVLPLRCDTEQNPLYLGILHRVGAIREQGIDYMENDRTLVGDLASAPVGIMRRDSSIVPPCPGCAYAHSHRSRRHPWERLLRLRAFQCTVCSRRFSRMDGDAEPWRTLKGRIIDRFRRPADCPAQIPPDPPTDSSSLAVVQFEIKRILP